VADFTGFEERIKNEIEPKREETRCGISLFWSGLETNTRSGIRSEHC